MTDMNDDFDRCIAALQAIKLIRDFGTGVETAPMIRQIIEILTTGGLENSLRVHVAEALRDFTNLR